MKVLSIVLAVIGVVLVAAAVLGKVVGDPTRMYGHKVFALLVWGHTSILLGILAKLFEKK